MRFGLSALFSPDWGKSAATSKIGPLDRKTPRPPPIQLRNTPSPRPIHPRQTPNTEPAPKPCGRIRDLSRLTPEEQAEYRQLLAIARGQAPSEVVAGAPTPASTGTQSVQQSAGTGPQPEDASKPPAAVQSKPDAGQSMAAMFNSETMDLTKRPDLGLFAYDRLNERDHGMMKKHRYFGGDINKRIRILPPEPKKSSEDDSRKPGGNKPPPGGT